MNRNKLIENRNLKKENEESKIPKSAKLPPAKEKCSKTIQSSKTTVKTITVRSSKEKQTRMINHQMNVKRMSIVKISKDVMTNFQTENLKSDDLTTEYATQVPFLDKENNSKRVLQKEKSSQTSQKQSGSLQKKPSVSDLKKGAAFGGIKFTSKRKTCLKADVFETLKKELKKGVKDKHPTGPSTKEMKTVDSDKPTVSKDLELPNDENLENIPPNEAESLKVTSLNLKETALKSSMVFGGIPFKPKWESTPLKPDLFKTLPKELKLCPTDVSPMWLEKTPVYKKSIVKEKTELEKVTIDEIVQPRTEETEHLTTASITINGTGDKVYTAFAGMRLTPKTKSTFQKPDIFENLQKEIKNDDQELHPSGAATEQEKISPVTTKTKLNTEAQPAQFEELKQASTKKIGSLETISPTMKETGDKVYTAFAGMRLTPKKKSTFQKPDIFKNHQKEIKNDDLELYPSGAATEQEKMSSVVTNIKLRAEAQASQFAELKQSVTPNIGSMETVSPTMKETGDKVYTAFAGIRLKPKRKSTFQKPDIFENLQKEIKNDGQELNPSGVATEQEKMSSIATKTELKSEARSSASEELKQCSTPKIGSLETVSTTMKETNHLTVYGGIRFAPKWKSTPIRPDIFDRIQKESKTDHVESYPAESFTKELKKIPDSIKAIKKLGNQQSAVEKLKASSIQKPESSENMAKNVKEDFAKLVPTFAGLRFKPRQKNLRDVFEARKAKIGNQAQS